jgi:hypothetical protein
VQEVCASFNPVVDGFRAVILTVAYQVLQDVQVVIDVTGGALEVIFGKFLVAADGFTTLASTTILFLGQCFQVLDSISNSVVFACCSQDRNIRKWSNRSSGVGICLSAARKEYDAGSGESCNMAKCLHKGIIGEVLDYGAFFA